MKSLTIKVSAATHAALKEAAKDQKLSISELGRSYLDDAVSRRAWEVVVEPILPEIRETIRKKLFDIDGRLTHLMRRSAIESGATKRLVLKVLTEFRTATNEEITQWEKDAWSASQKTLYTPLKNFDELVETFESTLPKGETSDE